MARSRSEYLHPNWQRRRLQIMQRAGFACESCGVANSTLHIHHTHYSEGAIWDTPDIFLRCYCEQCHEEYHNSKDSILSNIQFLTLEQLKKLSIDLELLVNK